MHEYAIVEHMVEHIDAELRRQGVTKVLSLHLRRGSTFAEEPLRQAYEILSPGSVLDGAELVIEDFSVTHTCDNCGATGEVNADDLIGHLHVCPSCGMTVEIDEAGGLELIDLTIEGDDAPIKVEVTAHHHDHHAEAQ